MPEALWRSFVFKKGSKYYGPAGARWSVAVGQSITWMITDIEDATTILTMIDNIAVGAPLGEERAFIKTVRTLVQRIKTTNLQTTPSVATIEGMTDSEILDLARQEQTFLRIPGMNGRANGRSGILTKRWQKLISVVDKRFTPTDRSPRL